MTKSNSTEAADIGTAKAQPSRASAIGSAMRGDIPPLSKENWNHSEMVLVYYAADPEMDRTAKWSIAYYHHRPPFDEKPHWIDFNTSRGAPDFWWPLPELPNAELSHAAEQPKDK